MTTGLDFSTLHRASLYATPNTPRAASPYQTGYSGGRNIGNTSRKRIRTSHSPGKQHHTNYPSRFSGYATPGTVSPPPLANDRYCLKSGYDTPTADQADAFDPVHFSTSTDCHFKRLTDDSFLRNSFSSGLDGSSEIAGPLARERNGKPRITLGDQDPSEHGWQVGRSLVGTVFGVAGFVFHFCTAGAFRGFQAGGGQAWSFNGDQTVPELAASPSLSRGGFGGSWHDSDFAQDEIPSPSYVRASKKVKSSHTDDGGLRSSWVMVSENETQPPFESPRAHCQAWRGASSASPAGLRRVGTRPSIARSRPNSSTAIPSNGPGTAQASNAALRSPGSRATTTRAYASPASGRGSRNTGFSVRAGGADGPQSPLGEEGERLLRMKAKREREEDRELTRMNRRLEEMIRQGREALGTKYEIEELDDV